MSNENKLKELAVELIVDQVNGAVETTSRIQMCLIAREKGVKLTLDEASEVLSLMDNAVLYVTWEDPDDPGIKFVLDELDLNAA